eukprot:m.220271 g.220271  ORF g.220271 m.220271 type:complete len:52 (-) comp15596_c0_seq1:1498-1653(-)
MTNVQTPITPALWDEDPPSPKHTYAISSRLIDCGSSSSSSTRSSAVATVSS